MKKITVVLLLAAICSCKNRDDSSTNPVFNLETVKKSINDNNKLYRIAFLSGDSAAFADLHHTKTINMPPGQPIIAGQGAMGAMIKNVPKMGITDYSIHTTNVYGGPDDVIEEGTYEVYGKDKVLEKGKYIVIWKLDKSKWKIYRSIWNNDPK